MVSHYLSADAQLTVDYLSDVCVGEITQQLPDYFYLFFFNLVMISCLKVCVGEVILEMSISTIYMSVD